MLLSEISFEHYAELKQEQDFWNQKIARILEQEFFPPGVIKRFTYGANIVYSYEGKLVIKLFPAHLNDQFIREHEVLTSIQGKLHSVEIPQVVTHGSFEGWNYLFMTLVQGELLIDIWEQLSLEEKMIISHDLGKTIKQFHQVSITDLSSLPNNWDAFISAQFRKMNGYHQKMELKESLRSELDSYVEEKFLEKDPEKKLLTGEYTPFNLLLNRVDGKWKVTGVIDFADCFLGDADYDLLGPILFMFNSNPPLIYAFLESYGYDKNQLDKSMQKKLMSYAILHRFSDINFFSSQNQKAKEATNLQELATILFPFN